MLILNLMSDEMTFNNKLAAHKQLQAIMSRSRKPNLLPPHTPFYDSVSVRKINRVLRQENRFVLFIGIDQPKLKR